MSSKIPPIEALTFLNDTKWALAANVPPGVLDAARRQLSEFLQLDGSRVVSGNNGISVLLVFGGSLGEGEDLAVEISKKYKTSAYLLEFGDYASIRQFDGARIRRKKGHPADFLETYGVIAPGYEPGPLSLPPVTVIGVVDDVTLAEAQKAVPRAKEKMTANSRGVIVNDASFATIDLSMKLGRRSFRLFYDRSDGAFSCVILTPDPRTEESFDVGYPSPNYKAIDSILGETTLEGILRVLDIPRHMLFPGTDASGAQSSSSA